MRNEDTPTSVETLLQWAKRDLQWAQVQAREAKDLVAKYQKNVDYWTEQDRLRRQHGE